MHNQHNIIVKSKLSINRSLNQISHMQAMFLLCEPRGQGSDPEMTESMISLLSSVRRELRQTQSELEKICE